MAKRQQARCDTYNRVTSAACYFHSSLVVAELIEACNDTFAPGLDPNTPFVDPDQKPESLSF